MRLALTWRACCVLGAQFIVVPAVAQEDAAEPSFDCAAAAAPVEKMICADANLADLDRVLADSYHAALATRAGEAQMLLREEQRVWVENRSLTCGIDGDVASDADPAIGCLSALYRARIAELRPGGGGGNAAVQSGYGWLMGDWTVAAVRSKGANAARAEAAKAQISRVMRFAEAPLATLGGASCSFPHYSAEPAPGPQFGDLSDYPVAVMVRVSCVGIALLDVVRLTDDKILMGEGGVVFELERRR